MARAHRTQLLEVVFEAVDAGSPEARSCLERYFDELRARLPGGFQEDGCGRTRLTDFQPPVGSFIVGRSQRKARACGGVRLLTSDVAEIKRMWIDPDLRGRGLGHRLLAALEAEARALGATVVRLDTSAHLEQAVNLYQRSGYRRIKPYNDNQHATDWFEKLLEKPPRGVHHDVIKRLDAAAGG